jgi:hypothetical protein
MNSFAERGFAGRTWRSGVVILCAPLLASCAAGLPSSRPAIEEEARAFMAGYESEMRERNGDALAARYHRQGAYWLLQGRKRFLEHDSIVRYFRETWSAPAEFRWDDLSFEVLGRDAVVVVGTMRFDDTDSRSAIGSYTALLVREDGVLRIRVEDEAFDNFPAAACPAAAAECDVPLDAGTAARYLGEYDQGSFRWRMVAREGEVLLDLPWDSAVRVVYYGDDEFRLADDPGVRILFEGDGERATSYSIIRGLLIGRGRRVDRHDRRQP